MHAARALGAPVVGAYGLSLPSLSSAADLLVAAPPSWPALRIEYAPEASGDGLVDTVEDDWAEYRSVLGTGTVRMEREPLLARFHTRDRLTDHAMVHPGLALIASIANRWLGRDAFHAGAFVAAGGAWGVLGAKEAGKSSLLAGLALLGVPIIADDVLVIDGDDALPGPRCIDLRPGAAEHLGAGTDIGVVGVRSRWRLQIEGVPAAVPMRGWIVPGWGDEISVEPTAPSTRPPALHANLALNSVPTNPLRLLRLAGLHFLTFNRPQRWDAFDDSIRTLLGALPD